MSWLGEFFGAIPDVFVALWRFGDGWLGVGVTVGSLVLFAVFLLGAQRWRDSHGWASAVLGITAALVGAWWIFGILPSAWIYFADSEQPLLADTIIPSAVVLPQIDLGAQQVTALEIASDFYIVFRDSVVMIETMIGMVAFGALALAIQKRYPRGLAEGEEQGTTSGGYK